MGIHQCCGRSICSASVFPGSIKTSAKRAGSLIGFSTAAFGFILAGQYDTVGDCNQVIPAAFYLPAASSLTP